MAVNQHLRQNAANLEAVGNELLDHLDGEGETLAALVTNFNALLAKLDTDAGVNDEDFVSELGLDA